VAKEVLSVIPTGGHEVVHTKIVNLVGDQLKDLCQQYDKRMEVERRDLQAKSMVMLQSGFQLAVNLATGESRAVSLWEADDAEGEVYSHASVATSIHASSPR
jgi:hypothetical protein